MPDEPHFNEFLHTLRSGMNYTEADILAAHEEVERIDAELAQPATIHPFPRASARGNGKLVLRTARMPAPDAIPPRQWLYGTQLIRGHVTVLVAPGGTGKSAYAMGVGISIAARRSYLGDHIFAPVNVAIFNLDDPMDELDRRVAAFMLAHKIHRDDLDGRLFLEDCDGHGLTLAAQARDDDGFYVAHPDEKPLIELLKANDIGLVICDPFAESHTLEENNNPQMIQAAAVWRRVARAANCAVLLVHHVRKGTADGIDAARGAKALTDSARVGLLMTVMSAEEAETCGIEDEDRLFYVRLDDAKRNMAPAAKAKWFRLTQIQLGNTFDATYPSGDNVAAIVAWKPPDDELKAAPNAELNAALDAIRDGPGRGVLYRASKRGGASLWCGNVLMQMFRTSESAANKLVKAWLKSGLLFEDDYHHPEWRRTAKGVRINEGKRPTF